jgi:hypothetical protein
MKNAIGFLLSLTLSFSVFSKVVCPHDRADYFCISEDMAPNSEIKIFDFYQIPIAILQLFQNETSKLTAPIQFDLNWESPYFGAGVSYYQDLYKLMVLGGTTRIQYFSKDAYAAVICHELGHIIGGAPFQTFEGAEWSSSEGQSDFFAANVCLKKYFKALGFNDEVVKQKIEKAGYEMIIAFKPFETNNLENQEPLVRFTKTALKSQTTLFNTYPTLACRYENFLDPVKRPNCWYRE